MTLEQRWTALLDAGKVRWMPGMLSTRGPYTERYEDGDGPWIIGHAPDFTDPATLGCLLALVREAWGNPHMKAEFWRGPRIWTCKSDEVHSMGASGRGTPKGKTEAEALLAALEAVP